jgi:hypothetical protein
VIVRELAAEFGRSEGVIKYRYRYTIGTYANTGTTQERPRSGRPSRLSLHQKKLIYRKARAAPRIEYPELARVSVLVQPDGLVIPHYTGRLRELASPITARPKLNRRHVAKRLQFCRQHRHFQWHQRTVKFPDECSVQKGSGSNQEWCYGHCLA